MSDNLLILFLAYLNSHLKMHRTGVRNSIRPGRDNAEYAVMYQDWDARGTMIKNHHALYKRRITLILHPEDFTI